MTLTWALIEKKVASHETDDSYTSSAQLIHLIDRMHRQRQTRKRARDSDDSHHVSGEVIQVPTTWRAAMALIDDDLPSYEVLQVCASNDFIFAPDDVSCYDITIIL